MVDIILEEKIAALQKIQKKIKHLKKQSEKQEEVVPEYTFVQEEFLNQQINIPIIDDYFKEVVDKNNVVILKNGRNLVVTIAIDEVKSIPNIREETYKIGKGFSWEGLYCEITEIKEMKKDSYIYQYVNFEMDTSIGKLEQDTLVVYRGDKSLNVVLFYSKEAVKEMKQAIQYMMEHLIWDGELI